MTGREGTTCSIPGPNSERVGVGFHFCEIVEFLRMGVAVAGFCGRNAGSVPSLLKR